MEENEVTLASTTEDIVDRIKGETDQAKLKELTDLFIMNQSKKNIIRSATFNDVLDQIAEQMRMRMTHKSDEFSNKDLVDWMKVIQDTVNKTGDTVEQIKQAPSIQVNQVNINSETLDSDSKQRVMEFIQSVMRGETKIDDIEIEGEIKDAEETT